MVRTRPYAWLVFLSIALPLLAFGGPATAEENERVDLSLSDRQQDLVTARKAIVDERYADAIPVCERMLRRDEYDLDALKIKGSAYFLMNQPERARRVWQRALQLSPRDEDILAFMPKVTPLGRVFDDEP